MELNHLKYFYFVAKNQGFTKARRDLHVEQPSISRAVLALEEELGVTLFEREKRSVRLTKVGREIFHLCDEIFTGTENIRRVAESERTECKGILRFGAANAVSSHLIPKVHQR